MCQLGGLYSDSAGQLDDYRWRRGDLFNLERHAGANSSFSTTGVLAVNGWPDARLGRQSSRSFRALSWAGALAMETSRSPPLLQGSLV